HLRPLAHQSQRVAMSAERPQLECRGVPELPVAGRSDGRETVAFAGDVLEDEFRRPLEQMWTASRVVNRLIDPPPVRAGATAPHLERSPPMIVNRTGRP